jgi:hypothetical protein
MIGGSTQVTWKGDEFLRLLPKAVDEGLTAAAERLHAQTTRIFGRQHGGRPSAPGMPPNSQTGTLRGRMSYTPGRNGLATVYSPLAYARFLERGGVITPKRAKMLAFPISAKGRSLIRSHGTPARAIDAAKRAARGRKRVAMVPTRSGGFVVGYSDGKGKLDPLFMLTRRSVVAARPWAKPSIALARGAMIRAATQAAKRYMLAHRAGGAA